MLAEPQQLRCGEPGQRPVPRQLDEAGEPDAPFDLIALGSGALVVSEGCRTDHSAPVVDDDEAYLTRQAEAATSPSATSASADSGGAPPVLGILLGPAGSRARQPVAS